MCQTPKMNDVCPVGQMMLLPLGKNDAATFGRNDVMRSAHARSVHHEAKPRIIPEGYIMFRCGGTHHLFRGGVEYEFCIRSKGGVSVFPRSQAAQQPARSSLSAAEKSPSQSVSIITLQLLPTPESRL